MKQSEFLRILVLIFCTEDTAPIIRLRQIESICPTEIVFVRLKAPLQLDCTNSDTGRVMHRDSTETGITDSGPTPMRWKKWWPRSRVHWCNPRLGYKPILKTMPRTSSRGCRRFGAIRRLF